MITIQFQENIPDETYQKIIDYIHTLGVKIKAKPEFLEADMHPELTEDDLRNIEISHQQAEQGLLISHEEVMKRAEKLCTK